MGNRPDMDSLNKREIQLIDRIVMLLNGMDSTERYAVLSMLEKILTALEGNRYYVVNEGKGSSRRQTK